MSAAGPRAINCTSCGAGQDVLGGGRIKVQVCAYCGAAMDASANFEVLARFSKALDLGSPFVPGMQGKIDGIDWTVIGSLAKSETWDGQTARWFEHQLYSETHGYAWLSVEDGHLVFTRRMRGETNPGFVTTAQVERANHRPSLRVLDNWIAYGDLDVPLARRNFRYHESGAHRIDQAAGSFTWLPKVGERDRVVTLVRDTEAIHCIEGPSGEREIHMSRYLPAEAAYESFGVDVANRPRPGIHILEPYIGWIHERFVHRLLMLCAGLSVLLAAFLYLGAKEPLGQGTFNLRSLPAHVDFTAPADGRLVEIVLRAFPENGWTGWEVEIEGPEGQSLGFHEVGIERYSGRDSDGSWTEGSSRATVIFKPDAPGPHRALLSYGGWEAWSRGRNPKEPDRLQVTVQAKRGTARWPFFAALAFAVLFILTSLPRATHAKRRAALSDWEDEDDD